MSLKKSIGNVLLAALVIIGGQSGGIAAMIGDIDASDSVNLKDVVLSLRTLTGIEDSLSFHEGVDVGGDNRITLLEALYGLSYVSQPPMEGHYYLSVTGNDSNNGSIGSPWATFAKAWTHLEPGDCLFLHDGTYFQPLTNPPSGTAESAITLRAVNDGMVTIDGQGSVVPLAIDGSYIVVEGLRFINSSANVADINGDFISIKRSGFANAGTGTYDAIMQVGGDNNLLEDTWAWGRGRAGILASGDTLTIRRFVARMDLYEHSHEQTAILLYGAKNVIVENAIALDFNPSTVVANAHTFRTGFRSRYGYDAVNHNFYGSLALNLASSPQSVYHGFVLGGEGVGAFENNIAYDIGGSGIYMENWNNGFSSINKATVRGDDAECSYFKTNPTINTLFLNCLSIDITGESSHNIFYNSPTAGTEFLISDPKMLYLPRVENGSPGYNSGLGGESRGAEILFRYVDGVETNSSLWPYPHEERIKADFQMNFGLPADRYRGFAENGSGLYGGPITLTSYIWEYLGNACPVAICGKP